MAFNQLVSFNDDEELAASLTLHVHSHTSDPFEFVGYCLFICF